MTKKIKAVVLILLCLVLCVNFTALCFASVEEYQRENEDILCVSYRGDTALYEQNSREAILSAFEKGADFVSVSVREDTQSQLVLCGENEKEVKGITLSEMLKLLGEKDILILDFDKELKDKIYDEVKKENALSKAYFRIKDKAQSINSWVLSKDEKPTVIGVCASFNIFTVKSFVKHMSGAPMVSLQSKNYFNVMYSSACYEEYALDSTPRAAAPMYDPDLCGQRSDSEDGWNDLIKKNFSVIETNNLDAFIEYRDNIKKLKSTLLGLVERAQKINITELSSVSADNLTLGMENAKALINESTASCDELQKAHSELLLAINTATSGQDEDTKKGALNITLGKIIAAVAVGLALLAAEMFINKMQKEKKR